MDIETLKGNLKSIITDHNEIHKKVTPPRIIRYIESGTRIILTLERNFTTEVLIGEQSEEGVNALIVALAERGVM